MIFMTEGTFDAHAPDLEICDDTLRLSQPAFLVFSLHSRQKCLRLHNPA